MMLPLLASALALALATPVSASRMAVAHTDAPGAPGDTLVREVIEVKIDPTWVYAPIGLKVVPRAVARMVVPRIPLATRPSEADSIVVEKKHHRLTLYNAGRKLRSYFVALGAVSQGPKLRAGDYRTPEGLYFIDGKNPQSHYYRSLHISYPNADDLARARTHGVAAGGDIVIHGLPSYQAALGSAHRRTDWTFGCIALTNEEIDELFRVVPTGTPIEIKP